MGCSLAAPFAATAPASEVAFRMPEHMNLQPQDVPDLRQSPVESSGSDLLIPEALGQDQRLYTSPTQDMRRGSDLIMLAEQTTRAPWELLEDVLRQRRPGAVVES